MEYGASRTEIAFSQLMRHFLVSLWTFLRPRPLFQPKHVVFLEYGAFRTEIAFSQLMRHFLVLAWTHLRLRLRFQPKYVVFWIMAPFVR